MSNPPAVPQALLHLLLPVDARETVSGDLLEEYRGARIPALGRLRANLWYWRQVGGIWLRAYWWFVVPVVLLLVVHDIFKHVSHTLWCVVSRRPAPICSCANVATRRRWLFWARGRVWELAHATIGGWIRRCTWDVLRRVVVHDGLVERHVCTRSRRCSSPIPTGFRRGNGARIARTRHRWPVSIPIRPMRPSSAGFFGITSEAWSSLASQC
jgi:hypothetical protein